MGWGYGLGIGEAGGTLSGCQSDPTVMWASVLAQKTFWISWSAANASDGESRTQFAWGGKGRNLEGEDIIAFMDLTLDNNSHVKF